MQTALHQDASSAERNRFINLVADFVDGADVSVRRTRPPVESTEGANYVADIRVVDIAVDDVSDDVVRMPLLANFVSRDSHTSNIVRLEQRGAIIGSEPVARKSLVQNTLNHTWHVPSLLPGCFV